MPNYAYSHVFLCVCVCYVQSRRGNLVGPNNPIFGQGRGRLLYCVCI